MEQTDSMAQGVPGVTPVNSATPLQLTCPITLCRRGYGGVSLGLQEKQEWEGACPSVEGFLPRSGHACKRQRWGSSQCCAGTGDKGAQPPAAARGTVLGFPLD